MPARRRARRCPICGQPTAEEHRPFCSRRCANIDLNRWLSGTYVVPASEDTPARNDAEDRGNHGDDERQ
jgi:endogenous inhibitor of DNA gyrase (YacG/DUF329 family)